MSDEPDQSNVALVLHEQEHITRIQELGIVNWYRHYFFSRTFRLEEELAAIKPQFNHLKRSGISVDIEHRARMLCGGAYLWPTSYDNAYSRLSAIWEAAPFPMQGAAAA
ncbi:MAG: hypothetical protein JWM81_61 [Candidatus Saccharibacteria bacterium]|nr:hypothetical protein [Candidatus Saccharibacteria bacterium]